MDSALARLDALTESEDGFVLPPTAAELLTVVEHVRTHPHPCAPNRPLRQDRVSAAGVKLRAVRCWSPDEKLLLVRGPAGAGGAPGVVYVLDAQHRLVATARLMGSTNPDDVALLKTLREKPLPARWLKWDELTPALVHQLQAELQTALPHP